MDGFALWPGGPWMESSPDAEPVCTDSVLLADFPSLQGVTRAADFGAGSGVLSLILAARSPLLHIDLVELSGPAAAVAERNVARNGLDARLRVLRRDLRTLTEAETGRYQLIVSNPPYYAPGSGTAPAAPRQNARQELSCTLSELAESAARLLGDGGRLALVYPCQRLSLALVTLTAARLEPKRLRLVQARADKDPALALIECRKSGRPGLRTEPVLILKNPDGTDAAEARRIYRMEEKQ